MADLGLPTTASLRRRLGERFAAATPKGTWPGPEHMARAAAEVEAMLGGAAPQRVDEQRIAAAIERLTDGERLSFGDLVACTVGATVPVPLAGVPVRIVDSTPLTLMLRDQLGRFEGDPRRGRRLAFAVAHAVLSPASPPVGTAKENLVRLGTFLPALLGEHDGETMRSLHLLREIEPTVTELSLDAYVGYVTSDDDAMLPLIRAGAPSASWVWPEVVQRGLRTAAAQTDEVYSRQVDRYLEVVQRHEHAVDLGLGLMLERMARSARRPEHTGVRQLATGRWGDPRPRQNHPGWTTWTTEAARKMVVAWSTRRIIERFFRSLAGIDGDGARADFWDRYAESIDDLWIYTSEDTRRNRRDVVVELRKVLEGNVHPMKHSTVNAFAMQIGGHVFVEFSEIGNALYVYRRESLPFDVNESYLRPTDLRDVQLADIRLTHQGHWQERAVDLVGSRTGVWPAR